MTDFIAFARLTDIDPREIAAQMSDPRIGAHLPLWAGPWSERDAAEFVAAKEERWRRDGLGHWAILAGEAYAGWGGFQREGDEWDFGLVLRPEVFGLGPRIIKKAIAFAVADERIPFITFLLAPSRKNLGALARAGATFVGETRQRGERFLKYRLDTPTP